MQQRPSTPASGVSRAQTVAGRYARRLALAVLAIVLVGASSGLARADHDHDRRTRRPPERQIHYPDPGRIHGRLGLRAGVQSLYNDDGAWEEAHGIFGLEYIGMFGRHVGIGLQWEYFNIDEYRWLARGRVHEVELSGVPFHLSFLGWMPLGSPYVEVYGGLGPSVLNWWLGDLPPESVRGDEETNGQKYGLHYRFGLNFIVSRDVEFYGEYLKTWLANEDFGDESPQLVGGLRFRIP